MEVISKFIDRMKSRPKQEQDRQQDAFDYFIDEIIKDAYKLRASDIHLEPGRENYRVRVRIDGHLYERLGGAMAGFQHMINRIKFLANMNIAEKRLPQDGAIRWQEPAVDIRISTMPTAYGEKCVIRILESQGLITDLGLLGMTDEDKAIFSELLKRNSGLVLVTGPTGSGKSTTLYTALHQLNDIGRNIVTVEDPIEYMLDGINQMQIHEQRGVTFDGVLRSVLRQDPDVIMIGEIRDKTTADIAIRAALTGHMIMSTLHTNDAVSAFYRLLDMGLEDYLVLQAVSAIVSQRLVRKLCQDCQGQGCDGCRQTGYTGRVGVFEILPIDEDLADYVRAKGSSQAMKDYLADQSWMNMRAKAELLRETGVIDDREYKDFLYSV